MGFFLISVSDNENITASDACKEWRAMWNLTLVQVSS